MNKSLEAFKNKIFIETK